MLVPVLPSNVTDYWPSFEGHIEKSLPPTASIIDVDVNQILYSLMIGSMQCWLFMDSKEQITKGFILTTSFRDVSDVGTLIIYCAIIFDKTTQVEWKEELGTLKKFAIHMKCDRIAAFIANKNILAILKEWGANTEFTYATLDV